MDAASRHAPTAPPMASFVQRIDTSETTSAYGLAYDLATLLLPRCRLSVLPAASGVKLRHRLPALRVPKISLQCVIADVERVAGLALVAAAALQHEPHVAAAPRARSEERRVGEEGSG